MEIFWYKKKSTNLLFRNLDHCVFRAKLVYPLRTHVYPVSFVLLYIDSTAWTRYFLRVNFYEYRKWQPHLGIWSNYQQTQRMFTKNGKSLVSHVAQWGLDRARAPVEVPSVRFMCSHKFCHNFIFFQASRTLTSPQTIVWIKIIQIDLNYLSYKI